MVYALKKGNSIFKYRSVELQIGLASYVLYEGNALIEF